MTDELEPDREPGAPHPRDSFALVGHEDAERRLVEAMATGRMHHAWLIAGPKGVGKATLAYRLARRLLGARAGGGGLLGSDPADPVCRRIAQRSHPDLFVLRRTAGDRGKLKREIVAEDARALGGFFSLSAADGGWRVAIVDALDDLNRHGANALLKVLEEPPPRAALLLVAHAPGAALATIRSRCRRLALRPLNPDAMERALGLLAPPEPLGPEALRLASGRPGRAIAMAGLGADGLLAQMRSGLAAAARQGPQAMTGAVFERAGEDRFILAVELMQDWIERAVRLSLGVGAGGEDTALMQALAPPARLGAWVEAWSALADLRDQTEGLGMDPTHAMTRALDLMGRAAAGRASA